MARIDTLGNFLTDVADAIREKTGDSATITPADFDTEIESIPSGGGQEVEYNDVNFYDYDGTRVYSYSKDDFLVLNEMPSNPSHNGLIAQGWNWNLTDAKAYVTNYEKLNIGQMYITDDGSTRIYITLEEGRLAPYLGFAVNGTATIDWGDNSTDTVTGTSTTTIKQIQHTYSVAGNYVIKINSQSTITLSGGNSGSSILTKLRSTDEDNIYRNAIKKVEMGNAIIGNSAFKKCYSLNSIMISNNVTSIGQQAFYNCYSLKSVTIPTSFTNTGERAFHYCFVLKDVAIPNTIINISPYSFYSCYPLNNLTIPNSVTTIGQSAMSTCYSISELIIPSSVTSIEQQAFINCAGIAYYDFTNSVAVPTLANTNAFSGIAADCKIIVPDSLYENWIAATNWSTYSRYIIKESDYNA